MANFNSIQIAQAYPMSGVGLGGRTSHGARGEYTITAALAAADTIQMFDLPPRARIIGGFLKADDLDSGGTAIRLHLGDADDPDRYFSASNVAASGGVDTAMAATGLDFITTKKTRVYLTVSTAPTTGATTGTVVARLTYQVEEPA